MEEPNKNNLSVKSNEPRKREPRSHVYLIEKRTKNMEQLLRCAKPIEKITSHLSYLENKLKQYEKKDKSNQKFRSHLPSPSFSETFEFRPLAEIPADTRFLKTLIDTYYAYVDPKEHLVPKNRMQYHLNQANHLIYVVLALSAHHVRSDFGYNMAEARKYFFTLAQSQLPQAYANPSTDAVRGLLLMGIYETKQSHSFRASHYFNCLIRMCQQLDLSNSMKRIMDSADNQNDDNQMLSILPVIKLGSQYCSVLSGMPSIVRNLSKTIEPFESLASLFQVGDSDKPNNCTHDANSCHCYLSSVFDYAFQANTKVILWSQVYTSYSSQEFHQAYNVFCNEIQFDFQGTETRVPSKLESDLIQKYVELNLSGDEKITFHSYITYHMSSLITKWPTAVNFPFPVAFAPSTYLTLLTSSDELFTIVEEWDRVSSQYSCKEDYPPFPPIPSQITILLGIVYLNSWHSVQHVSPSVATTYLNKVEYLASLINQMVPECSGGGVLMKQLLTVLKNFKVPTPYYNKIQNL